MSKNSKTQLKTLIKKLIHEVLDEAERETVVNKTDIELNPPATFESYLKQNIGVSFTNKEFLASFNIPKVKPPFSRKQFEITYKYTGIDLDKGKMKQINKTTVIKKIKAGKLLVYKSFTLIEPEQKPEETPEPIKVTVISSDSFTQDAGDPQLLSDFIQTLLVNKNNAENIGL